MVLGEYLYFGHLFRFPPYAYPVIWRMFRHRCVFAMSLGGMYTTAGTRVAQAAGSPCIVAYVVISALVFFAKDYAFSRAVVVISGMLCAVFLPGWRLAAQDGDPVRGSRGPRRPSSAGGRSSWAPGASGQEVLRKLRERVRRGIRRGGIHRPARAGGSGRSSHGVEILGSLDTIGKVIERHACRRGDLLDGRPLLQRHPLLIARTGSREVNFRLVPDSLEAIVGKTSIDLLDALPLVDIEYNIHKPSTGSSSGLFDLAVSSVLLS